MEKIQTFRTQKIWPFWALLINIIIMATVIGALGHSLFLHNRNDLGFVIEVKEIIYENALVEVPDEQQLEYAMVRGMVDSLNDPYAVFVEPADHEIQTDQLHGNFGGIGTQLEKDTQNNWRIYPFPKSAAHRAGLLEGDILV